MLVFVMFSVILNSYSKTTWFDLCYVVYESALALQDVRLTVTLKDNLCPCSTKGLSPDPVWDP